MWDCTMGGASLEPVVCPVRAGGVSYAAMPVRGEFGGTQSDTGYEGDMHAMYGLPDADVEMGGGGGEHEYGNSQYGGSSGSTAAALGTAADGWEDCSTGSGCGCKRRRQGARRGGEKHGSVRVELVTYNALRLNSRERLCEVSLCYPRAIVGVQSTRQVRERGGPACTRRHTGTHVVYDFAAERRGGRGEFPAGVALLLPMDMERDVVQLLWPPSEADQGRAGAVRVKHADGRDVMYVVVYAAVEGAKVVEANRRLWRWVRDTIREMPRRCTPVVLTDANGHVGYTRTGADGPDARGEGPIGEEGAE